MGWAFYLPLFAFLLYDMPWERSFVEDFPLVLKQLLLNPSDLSISSTPPPPRIKTEFGGDFVLPFITGLETAWPLLCFAHCLRQ